MQELSIRDLKILLDLAITGTEESPWVWSDSGIALGYDEAEADQTIDKFRIHIGERENEETT